MKTFEYKILFSKDARKELKQLGKEGWELVNFAYTPTGNTKYIFKRKIPKTQPKYFPPP